MNRRWLKLAAAVLAPVLWCAPAGAAGEAPPRPGGARLLVVGSSAMAPMITELARRFEATRSGVAIEVQEGGSGRGYKDIAEGKADIGMMSRSLSSKEAGVFSFVVGRDGVGVVLHKSNPVASLSREQVHAIYTGKVGNWKEVGGKDGPITAITASRQYGAVEIFNHFYGIKDGEMKPHLTLGDNDERIEAMLKTPGAITFTSVGSVEQAIQAGRPLKTLPVEGRAASTRNMRTESYPLTRPLLLLTKAAPAGVAKDFINFVLSPGSAEVIRKYSFVPDID